MMRSLLQVYTLVSLLLIECDGLVAPNYSCFHHYSYRYHRTRTYLSGSQDNNHKNKKGYQFGDFTRSLGRKITRNEDYQIGDISKSLDQQAKARISKVTGKDGDYEFGDLTRWADARAKQKVTEFTGKETYTVGDISAEVVRRVRTGNIKMDDLLLMLRLVLQTGAAFTPIGRLLPVKFLIEILNVGLAQDIGGRLMEGAAKTLDERFKEAIVGDKNYLLGDKSKKALADSIATFTGKESYAVGDISRAVAQRMSDRDAGVAPSTPAKDFSLDRDAGAELEQWDRKFLEQTDAAEKGKKGEKTRI